MNPTPFSSLSPTEQHQQPTLEQLDAWCERALSSPSSAERGDAERRLRFYFPTFAEPLVESAASAASSADPGHAVGASGQDRVLSVFPSIKGPADSANLMMWFLLHSSKLFSQSYVVRRLRALVLNHLSVLSSSQKSDLRNGLINAIREKFIGMPAFLVDDIARTLALIVMFTWFDLPDTEELINSLISLGKTSDKHMVLSLQILRAFVTEFNRELPSKYISRQRRVVVTFRDKQLKEIFEHSLKTTRTALNNLTNQSGDISVTEDKTRILSESLQLQRDCLSFDFIGLAPDEASDDAVAIQVPSSWKDVIQTDDFLDVYFEGYKQSAAPPISSEVLQVLVQVASIRRSFYPESYRIAFVKKMSAGIVEILHGSIGLDEVDNYHHLCRLLARFRCIHTLVEIEEEQVYRELLSAVAQFTATGLTLWEWSGNSITPLLMFWAKVAATHDSRDNERRDISGDLISATLPRVIKDYLGSMIVETAKVINGESVADSPLDNTDEVLESVRLVASIARSSYTACGPVILELFRDMANKYQAVLVRTSSGGNDADLSLMVTMENQLAWIVFTVAQMIGSRQPYKSMPEDDEVDAELFANGLELNRLVQQRIAQISRVPGCEKLELAFLHLFHCFRTSYVGEQGYKVTGIYKKLSSLLGISESAAVLEIIMQKVLFNLKNWGDSSGGGDVVRRSLSLFYDLSVGYVSVRQMAKLDTIKMLLAPGSAGVALRELSAGIVEYKQRAQFYSGLSRIIFASEVGTKTFSGFVAGWTQMVDEVLGMSDVQFAQMSSMSIATLVRLLRDLRGFLSAVSGKAAFDLFFKWIYPRRIMVVHRCLELSDDPQVHVAALKFMCEFVYNRTQRLNFDVASPNGVLIFREASKAIWTYGNRVLKSCSGSSIDAANGSGEMADNNADSAIGGGMGMRNGVVRDVYKERYKGVSVCFGIIMRVISGKYVPIGVMPLYNDSALGNAFGMMLALIKQIPVDDIIAYSKLGRATLSMLEIVVGKGIVDLVELDASAYEQVMRICVTAFDHAETPVSSAACAVIDSVFTHSIENGGEGGPDELSGIVAARRDISRYLVKSLLNIVLFEDRPNDWSFSRPLFCLMAAEGEFALEYTNQIVRYQAGERQSELIAALKDLFSATDFVVSVANRDSFTQALTQYRRVVTAKNLILMVPTDQTLGAPVQVLDKSGSGDDGDNAGDSMAD